MRKAGEITGVAAADFSRIRRVKLDRFTINRLMAILNRLGQEVEVTITVTPRQERSQVPSVHPYPTVVLDFRGADQARTARRLTGVRMTLYHRR